VRHRTVVNQLPTSLSALHVRPPDSSLAGRTAAGHRHHRDHVAGKPEL
jgi:hypothetical protein